MTRQYLTTRDVATITGHCEDHIRNMASLHKATKGRKGLKGYQRVAPKGPWGFTPSDVQAFMEGTR